jgi:hypothetical protein
VHLSADVERKRLAGLLPTTHQAEPFERGLYSRPMTRRTYAALERQAARLELWPALRAAFNQPTELADVLTVDTTLPLQQVVDRVLAFVRGPGASASRGCLSDYAAGASPTAIQTNAPPSVARPRLIRPTAKLTSSPPYRSEDANARHHAGREHDDRGAQHPRIGEFAGALCGGGADSRRRSPISLALPGALKGSR